MRRYSEDAYSLRSPIGGRMARAEVRAYCGRATTPNDAFDWDLLYDPEGRNGEDRIDYQVVKANVDPGPAARVRPQDRRDGGFAPTIPASHHLFLAGSWIDTGFNVESIESAVISGKQAARAIIGAGDAIDGEDFLHFERGLGGSMREWRSAPRR